MTIDPVYAGRCAHLNSAGEYEMGVDNSAGNIDMPIFLFQNSDDPDVSNDGGDAATEAGAWIPTAPTGTMMGLVAAGAYELFSTEFEPEGTAGTYAPNDPITATPSNSDATTGGRLTKLNVTAYGDHVVGVVSRGLISRYGKDVLSFWPCNLPANSTGS
ncbi:MAG: hypothetical protein ACYSWU_04305 [Planctomycetota bacterium]